MNDHTLAHLASLPMSCVIEDPEQKQSAVFFSDDGSICTFEYVKVKSLWDRTSARSSRRLDPRGAEGCKSLEAHDG